MKNANQLQGGRWSIRPPRRGGKRVWCFTGLFVFGVLAFGIVLALYLTADDGDGPLVKNGQDNARPNSQKGLSESEEPVDFHELVKSGSLDQLREALNKGADANAPGRHQQTPLMAAIEAEELEKMKILIEHGADPELTDKFNTTSLGYAVNGDFAAGVRFLIGLGVDRGFAPKYPLKKVDYDVDWAKAELPKELTDILPEEEWKQMFEDTKEEREEMLAEADLTPTPLISDVQSVEILKIFLEAGDDLSLAEIEVKREYVGLTNEGKFKASRREYKKHKTRRYGKRNPQQMDNPFWADMIRLGGNAYSAKEHFKDQDWFSNGGAVWCYDRFGSSITPLQDGRFVQIGGEHEDYYDPEFCIYNDVVIHDGNGNFQIYGYPKKIFPPTDHHTATLVQDSIYIIGCLGYPEQREAGRTPVYRLKLESWEIEDLKTTGETPSWLHSHRAKYDAQNNVIQIEGGDVVTVGEDGELEPTPNESRFELDITSLQWRPLNSAATQR